jgi:hypothetical protein
MNIENETQDEERHLLHERMRNLLQAEHQRWKAPTLRRQPHVTERMRTILVDWLIEVSIEYHLCRLTFHRMVEYIDRFLSISEDPVSRSDLQLVGLGTMVRFQRKSNANEDFQYRGLADRVQI